MSVKVTIIGTVGKEPEQKTSKDGKLYAQFSVATWTGVKGQDRWWNILAFNQGADYVFSNVHRGSYIEVHGKFDYSETEKDGKRYQNFKCLADRVSLTEKPTPKVPAPERAPEVRTRDFIQDIPDMDNIPF